MRSVRTIIAAILLIATASPLPASEIPQGERRSGFSFMTPETQAMQNDDTSNPGMLWVLDGETLWKSKTGAVGKACADCHDDAHAGMKGVAARYPAFDGTLGQAVHGARDLRLTSRPQPLGFTPICTMKRRGRSIWGLHGTSFSTAGRVISDFVAQRCAAACPSGGLEGRGSRRG